jgi:uncharacterized protein
MNPIKLIQKYYNQNSLAYRILVAHSENVARKALFLAKRVKHLHPDFQFIEEAAMLHDIGIFLTDAPEIGCFGKEPYIRHGLLGRELLDNEGLPKHALVCERHTGTGISREDIQKQRLPLPERDMLPISLEEQIVCFADKFYSKNPQKLNREKSLEKIKKKMGNYGEDKLKKIEEWVMLFRLMTN